VKREPRERPDMSDDVKREPRERPEREDRSERRNRRERVPSTGVYA
jgi:hypothetical protein